MNLYRRTERKGIRPLLFATAVVAIIFAFDFATAGFLRNTVRGMSNVVWSAGAGAVASIGGSGLFSTRRALESENKALKDEVTLLRLRSSETMMLRDELNALQSLVHIAERNTGITAALVSSVKSSPYGTFMIGAGVVDGILEGNLVLAGDKEDGFVLGRVQEANAHRSLVEELFAPDTHLEGNVRDVLLTIEGKGSGNARAEVPFAASITTGDIVFSREVSGRAIGVVGKIETEPGGAYKTIFIQTPVSLTDLRFVYVVSHE